MTKIAKGVAGWLGWGSNKSYSDNLDIIIKKNKV